VRHKLLPSETVLPDDYPMYGGYVYIIDGVFQRSNESCPVSEYKRLTGAREIRRCDIFGHPDARLGDSVETETS
jgi:hypothetical protein